MPGTDSVPLPKSGLVFPWEPGGDGMTPLPSEGLWALPRCYLAFPWDVHGFTLKGKECVLLAAFNTVILGEERGLYAIVMLFPTSASH